jgi:hypothetical protein
MHFLNGVCSRSSCGGIFDDYYSLTCLHRQGDIAIKDLTTKGQLFDHGIEFCQLIIATRCFVGTFGHPFVIDASIFQKPRCDRFGQILGLLVQGTNGRLAELLQMNEVGW